MCLNTFYTNYIGFCNEIKLILQIRSRTKAITKAVIYLIKIMIFLIDFNLTKIEINQNLI